MKSVEKWDGLSLLRARLERDGRDRDVEDLDKALRSLADWEDEARDYMERMMESVGGLDMEREDWYEISHNYQEALEYLDGIRNLVAGKDMGEQKHKGGSK